MDAENKIYLAYLESNLPKLYYNEIKRHTNLSHSSLQNILNKLVKQNILREERTFSNRFYIINNKKIFSLKFSEIAVQKFNDLNIGVKNPLRNFLNNIPKEIYTLIIFGSASAKEEKKGSDIDLLIVSDKKIDILANKKHAEVTSKYPLSVFQTTVKQFIDNKDHIIIQARKTGFPIYKEQNYYEVVLDGS